MFEVIVNSLAKTAKESIVVNQGDYLVDGLWHCGACNTPKQTRISISGKVYSPMCLCKCGAKKVQEAEDEKKRLKKLEKIKDMRKAGFPESEMEHWTFGADDAPDSKASRVAMNYVEHFDEMYEHGKGLVFYGEPGTGKTFAAACITNALIDQERRCLMTNFPRLINILSGMYEGKQDYIDSLNDFELLVIDDFAVERNTEYVCEIVQNIIDSRYRAQKPMIITTNLTGDELKHPSDMRQKRTYSRIYEMCLPVQVEGKDRRGAKLRNDLADFSKILGL